MAIDNLVNQNPTALLAARNAQAPQVGGATLGAFQPQQMREQLPQRGIMSIASDIMEYRNARRNNALMSIQRALRAKEAGFPIDPKSFVRWAKQADLPVDTSPEAISAYLQKNGVPHQGPASPQPPGTTQPQSQQGQMPAAQQVNVGQMNKRQRQEFMVTHWAQHALAAAAQQGQSIQDQANLQEQVTKLKTQALDGATPALRHQAVGRLMSINQIPFSISHAEWNDSLPKQRATMINIAAGHETQAQKEVRIDDLQKEFMSSGKFSDPEAAMQAATALANGQAIPAAVRAKMKPFTAEDLVQQAQLANELVRLGVPPDKINGAIQAATLGGLSKALPTGINPIVDQQLQIQKKQLELAQQRTNIEGFVAKTGAERLALEASQMQLMGKKLDVAMTAAKNQALWKNIEGMAELKRAGMAVPQEVVNGYVAELANAAGMDVKQVKHWWQYVTGGTSLQISPNTGRADKLVDQYTGASPSSVRVKSSSQTLTPKYHAGDLNQELQGMTQLNPQYLTNIAPGSKK